MADGDGIEASLRIRVGSEDAHYGTIAAGAYVMQLFGDLATEITVRRDGDEGLLRAYDQVEFLSPVRPGDFLSATSWNSVATCSSSCWKADNGTGTWCAFGWDRC